MPVLQVACRVSQIETNRVVLTQRASFFPEHKSGKLLIKSWFIKATLSVISKKLAHRVN